MPAILDDAVKSIMEKNPKMRKSSAYAIATSQLQKAGDLKEGTQEPTRRGARRAEMSKANRAKTRARKYRMERQRRRRDERNTEDRD